MAATEQMRKGLCQLPQITMELNTAPMIRTPPMVGVPLLSWAECTPVSRIWSRILRRCTKRIKRRLNRNRKITAVKAAMIARKVM